MLALGIRYLNGFVAASQPDGQPEWPPHPARVFMALAAAFFQTGADSRERDALLWLESLPPPELRASEATPRAAVRHYVPVNDKAVSKSQAAIIRSIPQLTRDRQPRAFARAWLEDDTVYLVWRGAVVDDDKRDALSSLCGKVTRIGHSTSLVHMWVARQEEVGEATWVPDDGRAETYLRVAGPGTLQDLERRYNAQAREARGSLPQFRPKISLYQGYARRGRETPAPSAPGTVFSPHPIIFSLRRQSGPLTALGLQSVLQVVQRWREAILSYCEGEPERVRELVSGHRPDGSPLKEPHLALMPLAFVGHPNADGHLLGLAAVLPARIDPEERRQVLRILGRVDELRLGPLGAWSLAREPGGSPMRNLSPEAWTAYPSGATRWSTVTPIAFDRHPRRKDRADCQRVVEEMVARACADIGLPRPQEVIVTPVSAHLGVPPAHAFPRQPRKDGTLRRHAHAIIVFKEPVCGPMLIGAGRYRGYGAARPLGGEWHGDVTGV